LLSENTRDGPFKVMLVTKFFGAAIMEPDEAKQDKIVEGYEQMHTFFGEMNLRKVERK